MRLPSAPQGCLGWVTGAAILVLVFGATIASGWAWTWFWSPPGIDPRFEGMRRVHSITPVEVHEGVWKIDRPRGDAPVREPSSGDLFEFENSVTRVLRSLPPPDLSTSARLASDERIASVGRRVARDGLLDTGDVPESALAGIVVEADAGKPFVIVALHGVPYGDRIYENLEVLYEGETENLVTSRVFAIDGRDTTHGRQFFGLFMAFWMYWLVALGLVWRWQKATEPPDFVPLVLD